MTIRSAGTVDSRAGADRGGVRQEDAARGQAGASADHDGGQHGRAPARAARAGCRAGDRAARAGADRLHCLGVARRSQSQLAAQAGVLRLATATRSRPPRRRCSTKTPAVLKRYPDLDGHDRGPLRRARHRRVQSGIGRTPGGGRARVSRLAGHSGRQAQDRQLRQGIPVRSGTRRSRVREEPARAFRHHRKMREHHEPSLHVRAL